MKVALLGYGKMGKMIESLLEKYPDDQICLRIDSTTKNIEADELKACDVAIDFSSAEAAPHLIMKAVEAGVPVVSGTTGWLEQKSEVETMVQAQKGGFLYASNFSVGVNIFFALNQKLAEMMSDQPSYDVEVEETHHIHKKDAPSGTAISLGEDILKNVKRKKSWKLGNTTSPSELLILANREDEVHGTHEIRYKSSIDQLTIKHEAFSREGFAAGAILSARWIIGKQGLFTMQDVLHL